MAGKILISLFIFGIFFVYDCNSACRTIIETDLAPPPVMIDGKPLFSQGVLVDSTLYVSGQLGSELNGTLVEGFEGQTRKALDNLGEVLKAGGASFKTVSKVTVLLADINNFGALNPIYATYFTETPPVRTAFQVGHLPLDGLIEIEAIAFVENPPSCVP